MVIHCCIKKLLLQRLDFLFGQLQEEEAKSVAAFKKFNVWQEQGELFSETGQQVFEEAQSAVGRYSQIAERRNFLCNALNQFWLDDAASRFSSNFTSMTSSLQHSAASALIDPKLNLSSLSVWLDENSKYLGIDFAFGQDKMKQIYRDITGYNLKKRLERRSAVDEFQMTPTLTEEKCGEVSAQILQAGGISRETLSWCARYEPIFRVGGDGRFVGIDVAGRIENEDTLRVVLSCFLEMETFKAIIGEFTAANSPRNGQCPRSPVAAVLFDEVAIAEAINSSKTSWTTRAACLVNLARHLCDDKVSDSEFQRVMTLMRDGLCLQICDLRSSLSKTASECCAQIAAARPVGFVPFCVGVLDALFSQVHVATKPTSEAAKSAVVDVVLAIVFCEIGGDVGSGCRTHCQSLMAYLSNILETSKHEKQRAHVCTILSRVLSQIPLHNEEAKVEEHDDEESEDVVMADAGCRGVVDLSRCEWKKDLLDMLKTALNDTKPIVKREAMLALVELHKTRMDMAAEVYGGLKLNQKTKFDEIVHGKSRRVRSGTKRNDIRKWKRMQMNKVKAGASG